MPQKMTVFIHTNPQQMVGAKVGEYSLRKNSKNNAKFDVKILNLWDFPSLTNREGTTYLRKGKHEGGSRRARRRGSGRAGGFVAAIALADRLDYGDQLIEVAGVVAPVADRAVVDRLTHLF